MGRVAVHGMCRTRVYNSWNGMKRRCNDQNFKFYSYYGGRGITYDPKWETFEGFFEDMGKAPPGHSLDRIDPNGNYTKENCRWLLKSKQQANMRNNRNLTYKGKRQNINAWSLETGIPRQTLYNRLNMYGTSKPELILKGF